METVMFGCLGAPAAFSVDGITTIRFELVPPRLLSTPHVLDVLVNICSLTTTQTGSHAVSRATSATTSSSSSDPFRISPTSKANTLPPVEIVATLSSASRTRPFQTSSFPVCVIPTSSGSMPANQHRIQLVGPVVDDVHERRRRNGKRHRRPVIDERSPHRLPEEPTIPPNRRLVRHVHAGVSASYAESGPRRHGTPAADYGVRCSSAAARSRSLGSAAACRPRRIP